MSAITAAVVGVILNLAIWFSLHVLFGTLTLVRGYGISVEVPIWSSVNWPAVVLTAASLLAIFLFRAPLAAVLFSAALAGLAWRMLLF